MNALRWDQILGGFGLFMFGIEFMGRGLKAVAGNKMRDWLNKYVSTKWQGLLVGIILTVMMQSSSASTAITIGMVRAGLMGLSQAASIVLGANIGATVTTFLISTNFSEYTLYIVFVGSLLLSFSKKRSRQNIGTVVLGFGLIFFGLKLMQDALVDIQNMPEFLAFAEKMSANPFLGLLAGVVMTCVIQASSATIGVVQVLYSAGALSLEAVLPFVFGANIGTTITGVLASLGGSQAAKQTAGIHTMFNLIGTIISMILLKPYAALIRWLAVKQGLNPMMQVAVSHIFFNAGAVVVMLPLLNQLCELIRKWIPDEEKMDAHKPITLDPVLARDFPQAAAASVDEALGQIKDLVYTDVMLSRKMLIEKADLLADMQTNEGHVDADCKDVTKYLVSFMNSEELSTQDMMKVRMQLEVISNLERIGDLAMNLGEFYSMVAEHNESFSIYAHEDIESLYDLWQKMFSLSTMIFYSGDKEQERQLLALEDEMDSVEVAARQSHFTRMANGQCKSPIAASIYCDVLANLERMGDHCCNIGKSGMQLVETYRDTAL